MLLEDDYKEMWDIFSKVKEKEVFSEFSESMKNTWYNSKKKNIPITPKIIYFLKDRLDCLTDEEKEVYHMFVYLKYKEELQSRVSIHTFQNSRDYLKKVNSRFYNKAQSYRKNKACILCKNAVDTPQGQYVKCKNDFINGLEVIREKLDLSVNKFATIFKSSSNLYYQYLNNQGVPILKTKNKIVSRLNEYLGKEYTIESIEELGRNNND